jgi:hypothetical protein
MFELSAAEVDDLVSQSVIPRRGKLGGAVPTAFTEQGVAVTPNSPKGGGKLPPPLLVETPCRYCAIPRPG